MKTHVSRALAAVALCASFLYFSPPAQAQNGLLREVYTNIFGGGIDALLTHPSFPDNPASRSAIPAFETPGNVGNNYGQRVRGFVRAPETGEYTFWIASDDQSRLYLSTNQQATDRQLIAEVFSFTNPGEYDREPTQRSAPIRLHEGEYYYIEALMVEGGGADHLSVRWQLPSGVIEEPIPGTHLFVEITPPRIARHPANVRVVENESASFMAELSTYGSATYQWFRNGILLPNETNLTLTLPSVRLSDSGSRFRIAVTNAFGGVVSDAGTLTVDPDITQPFIVSAQNPGPNNLVSITFSEPVSPSTATNIANYSLTGGVLVQNAVLDASGRNVILTLSNSQPLIFGTTYTITVNNVTDLASAPNIIDFDSQVNFTYGYQPLDADLVFGKRESPAASTRRTSLTISEIMYHPAARPDQRNIEFIEIFNSAESTENLSGYRLTGPIDFVFPSGTTIAPRGYVLVAASPSDVEAIYGLSRVYGPYSGQLPDSATLRLFNEQGAELLVVPYESGGDWPSAADGAGSSLVLARPSLGEANPRAWEASFYVGGSPGKAEQAGANSFKGLVINEFLANTDDPQVLDFIELFNFSSAAMNLSGLYITDDNDTNKFQIPAGTTIPPLGFIAFDQAQLGFALSAAGERIILRNAQRTRVIDAVRFGPQLNGVSTGRFPDGNPKFRHLHSRTPGSANSGVLLSDVVINEIMYNPASGNQDDEYLELFNRSGSAINLNGWRLQGGISYTFTSDMVIAPGGYVVIAKDLARLRANHPESLTSANSVGNFNGNLSNSGEKIILERPVQAATGGTVNYAAVNEVEFGTGGRWPKWTDGEGSSLELIDPNADNASASNWRDSDESGKGQWVTFERRGILDYGATNFPPTNPSRNLHVMLMGEGEALMDNVQVIPDGKTNVVQNPDFDSGSASWTMGGTHEDSRVEGADAEHGNVMHIRASDRGDTAANRIRVRLSEGLTNGSIATIRADLKWVRGTPEFLLRLHGNYLELAGTNFIPGDLGTPGRQNSRLVQNAGPAISDVSHSPVLPAANQSVTVRAQIHDPDRIGLAVLSYRVEPSTEFIRVPMTFSGAGFYTATIPGQAQGSRAAFFVEALDTRGSASRFPSDAPDREAIILFGDGRVEGNFANYRIWMSDKNLNKWAQREPSSNKGIDVTFVYNDERVIYNAESLFSGSPFHWGNYNSPTGNRANYEMIMPPDDRFLGQRDFVLNAGANLFSDSTGVREQLFFWLADQLNQPYNHRRLHHLFVNGQNRGLVNGRQFVFEDAQQPNRDFVRQWFPDDSDGELYKIEDWFEFADSATGGFFSRDADLMEVITTNLVTGLPEYKKERYRQWFRKRAVRGSAHDYSELFRLVSAVNRKSDQEFVAEATALIDIDEWMGAIAARHIVGDWDSFGFDRGKNMYAYKPENGKWQLLHWDISFGFRNSGNRPSDIFATIESATERMFQTPVFLRSYYRTLYEAAHGPLLANVIGPAIDSKYAAMVSNGINLDSPQEIKNWVENRRQYILSELGNASAPFAIANNSGANFTTNRNTLLLTGTAPVNVSTILINGVEYPVTWKSVTGWETRVALRPGQNNLTVQGYNAAGMLVSSDTIAVTVTSAGEGIEGRVVINEIHYNPLSPDSEFVELFNTSATTAYDLSGARLNGLGFTFGEGTVIAPRGFLVVTRDEVAFGDAFGFTIPVAGIFDGRLDNGGETISLLIPDQTGTNESVLAQVAYDDDPPWPVSADGTGASLQLINPALEITRVGNWAAGNPTPGMANIAPASPSPFPRLWVNEVAPNETVPWVELYSTASTNIPLAGMFLTDDQNRTKWAFPASTPAIAPGQRVLVYLDGATSSTGELHTSFRINPTNGFIALVVNDGGRNVVLDYLRYNEIPQENSYGAHPEGQAVTRQQFYFATPGAENNPASPPVQVFLNEWMASNSSTIADPDDNDFDDWFELFNAGNQAVDLSGYSLTDNPAAPGKYTLPPGTIIAPRGFLFIWADDESSTNGQLHASFQLSANGETIALFAPDGTVVDSVTFGRQQRDVSEGRMPDGGGIGFLPEATPGASNSGVAGLVTSASRSGNNIVLTWSSEAGATYVVEYKNNITDAWADLKTVQSQGASTTVTDMAGLEHRFYRIRQE